MGLLLGFNSKFLTSIPTPFICRVPPPPEFFMCSMLAQFPSPFVQIIPLEKKKKERKDLITGFLIFEELIQKGVTYTPLAHLPHCTLSAPPKCCISIVFNLSWDDCDTQEKLFFIIGFMTTNFMWWAFLLCALVLYGELIRSASFSGIALYFAVRLNKPPFYIKPPSKVLQINKTPK